MSRQQKTKHLNYQDYKKIITKDCETVCVDALTRRISSSLWGYPVHRQGNPLGYKQHYWLWRGHQLLRPVFDISREEKAYEIRKYITTIAKICAAQSREHLYKQELMKVHNGYLPEEIVEYIARYTWDIHLLL